MPRKAKEEIIEEKKTVSKKANTKTTKSTKTTKTTAKATSSKKKTSSTKKATTASAKKTSAKKTPARKSSTKKKPIIEYYDLPNLYNQTIVKILAQTPTILFVYWDISAEDRINYINKYGEDFFNNTVPYLTVTNQTKNYSFEVEINDFANSWYIHIPDSDCKYDVVLFRKPKDNISNHETIFITKNSFVSH